MACCPAAAFPVRRLVGLLLITLQIGCLWTSPVAAAKPRKPVLAVLDLTPATGVGKSLSELVTEKVRTVVQQSGRFQVIERGIQSKIVRMQKESLKACYAQECRVQLGRMLSAHKILAGKIFVTGAKYYVTLSLTDVRTSKTINQATDDFPKRADAVVQGVVATVYRVIGGSRGGAAQGVRDGTVYFVVEPPGARLKVGRTSYGSLPGRGISKSITLPPGRHTVTISRPGYRQEVFTIRVASGRPQTVKKTMLPRLSGPSKKASGGKGFIDVKAFDAATGKTLRGARILVDGTPRKEVAPSTLRGVAAGTRILEIRFPMYHSYRQRVVVSPNDIRPIKARLRPNFGGLRVESTPTGAAVYLDGVRRGKTPLAISRIESKAYAIKLSTDLYHDLELQAYVPEGKTKLIRKALRPAHGTLVVTSSPSGASVEVDGSKRGATPLTLAKMPSGNHMVRVTRDEHFPGLDRAVVRDGATTRKHFKLTTDRGYVLVTSSPKGAVIEVDGRRSGTTPARIKLGAGEHRVRISMNSPPHRPHEDVVQMSPGKTAKVHARLVPRLGTAIIISQPPGATLYLNGEQKGTTPKKLTGLFVGTYRASLKLAGRTPWSGSFKVTEGGTLTVEGRLSTEPALAVKCKPEGADVLLDGTRVGKSPLVIKRVKPGQRLVECRLSGYGPARSKVSVAPGLMPSVSLTLSRTAYLRATYRSRRVWSHVSTWTDLAALGTSAILLGGGQAAYSDYTAATSPTTAKESRGKAETMRAAGLVVGGTGVALVATGIVLWVINKKPPGVARRSGGKTPTFAFTPASGGYVFSAQGSF